MKYNTPLTSGSFSQKNQKHGLTFSLLALATSFLITGCVSTGHLRMGGADFTPNLTDNVQILNNEPKWNYAEIGLVQAQAGPLVPAVKVYRKLQEEAAKVGADAVIPTIPFDEFHSRSEDEYVGRVLKGTAIVRVSRQK